MRKLFLLLTAFISGFFLFGKDIPDSQLSIKSAKLCFEIKNARTAENDIFINGQKIGKIPLNGEDSFKKVYVDIPQEQLQAIATINIVNMGNMPAGKGTPGDMLAARNVYMEITTTNLKSIKSDIAAGPFTSFKTGIIDVGDKKKTSAYSGAPMPEIRLTLPVENSAYMKQPFFESKSGELYRDNSRKKWHGLDEVSRDSKSRTMCDVRSHEFVSWPKEYLLDMLERHNSGILLTGGSEKILKDQKDKIKFLREHGIKINLLYGGLDAYSRLPETEGYKEFFSKIEVCAPWVDIVGMDEWFLSPAVLKTDGGKATEITEKFLETFSKYAGYSAEDAKWAFKNHTSNDPRTLKAWEFCDKVQNDFAREFVRVAKKANPQIKTWISYIGRNWNKSVTSIDSAVREFDELLQCQTYWYGRAAKDSLNSSLVTAPIGMGKLFRAEYPDKFFWMGIDPGYTGSKTNEADDNSWGRKCYNNTTEEFVPYLALLYAVSDGIFIQSPGGGVWLLKNSPEIDGAFADKFADAVNLVSRIVPLIKTYRKSDIAYYYDPEADWETVRRVNRFIASRETNETSIGYLQQFCDVDVTKNISKYENIAYSGLLLPSKFDYRKQNIYLMYAPEYNERGNKIADTELLEKLNIKGFEPMGKNFFLSGGANENGCSDQLQIAGLPKDTLSSGMIIKEALYPIRKASYANSSNYFLIGARNKAGNILLNSLWPSFTRQDAARKMLRKDLDYFGWTKRDCPQVNGTDKIVAVAFRDARTAVLDFGKDASFKNVKIIMFNGREGVIRNETAKYERGMKIEIPPLNVLVAEGMN